MQPPFNGNSIAAISPRGPYPIRKDPDGQAALVRLPPNQTFARPSCKKFYQFLLHRPTSWEGLRYAGIAQAQVVLVDCDDETWAHRLCKDRNQPELANSAMMNWAKFLRLEAEAGGYPILDTSKVPLEESVERVYALFQGPVGDKSGA